MANTINLAKVNISLDEFQRLSKGDYNAGEVKLADETTLAKMNNHVTFRSWNTETISHAEVIAIKEAFVRALSGVHVAQDEIDKIRRELGLAPDGVADRSLAMRSVKPLTRQQIRDILDRNAATINAGRPANAHIRTSAELYGENGMDAADRAKRDAVNASLADDHRQVFINKDILNFQKVVSGHCDVSDYDTRQALCKIAEAQLDALLTACNGQPRENVSATATFRLPSGQTLTSPTGKSELEFSRQLEDIIIQSRESKRPANFPELFNLRLKNAFHNDKLLPRFGLLAAETADTVRSRLGAKGVPDGTKANDIVASSLVSRMVDEAAGGGRATVESLREPLLRTALETGARRIIEGTVAERLAALGRDDGDMMSIANIIVKRNPAFVERLASAQSPADVDDIIAEFHAAIADGVRIHDELAAVRAGVEDRVYKGIADKLGVSPEMLKGLQIELGGITRKADDLKSRIGIGNPPLSTKAEFQKAFDDLADAFVSERMARLDAVDALDLPTGSKNNIQAILLTATKVKDIDIAFLAAEAKKIDLSNLEDKLRSFAAKETVFTAMGPVSTAIRNVVEAMLKDKEEVGPDDRDAPIKILAQMVGATKPGIVRLLQAFYAKADVRESILNRGMDGRDPAYNSMAFELFSTDPQINRGVERTANVKLVFDLPPELGAFRAAGGVERAISAGYHRSELSMLAKAFTLHQAATGCTPAEALNAVLDHQSKTRRLFSYGGRFTENVDNFRAGLALMDKFAAWYANLAADFKNQNFDTVTKANAGNTFVPANAVRAYEMFVFQDMAVNPSVDLNEQDPEKLFGIEYNGATNFFTRGNGSGCTGTLVKLPPAKRQIVYAAFKALEPPTREIGQNRHVSVSGNEQVLARILRHYDEIVALKNAGQLDRAHLNKVLTPDLDLPPDASSSQVFHAIQDAYFGQYGRSPSKLMEISELLCTAGCTVTEAMNAMQGGERPAPLDDIASTTMKLEQIDGTAKGGREFMLGDLHRPQNPSYIENNQPVLSPENNHFTVNIEGRSIRCVVSGNTGDNAHVADQIEAFCGKVHVEQASAVMRGLSQGAHGPLLSILPEHGIANPIGSEHTPLTYTLSKNDETGAVTIRYSEPDGFPFKFHWETTVALDGTSSTTRIAVDM